jgi:hypothetical protein
MIFTGLGALILSACGGGDGGGGSSSAAVVISGTASYQRISFSSTLGSGLDFNSIQVLPIKGVDVQALGASGSVLASTTTSDTGAYSLSVAGNTSVSIRIIARTVSSSGAVWNVEVRDNTNGSALYVLDGGLSSSGSENSTRNLTATAGWTGSSYGGTRSAAPFAILDSIYDAIQVVVAVDASVNMDALDVFWSVNNSTANGTLTNGEIGSSFYSNDQIYILGRANSDTDEFDKHVVIHEWGHYFEDNLSRSDSIGGLHSIGDKLDMRVALSEGFGNAFSGVVTGDPIYRDSSGAQQGFDFQVNVETNSATNIGWFSEESVQTILYDIFDSAADANDGVTLGFSAIYRAMTSTAYRQQSTFTTIFSLAQQIKIQNAGSSAAIDTILTSQSTIVNDFEGGGETNNGGDANNLPVYKALTVGGGPVPVCSSKSNGENNKLGNRQFLLVSVSTAGSYTITATRISGLAPSNPDIDLYLDGTFIGTANSTVNNIEAGSATLAVDQYVIEVYEKSNVNNTSSTVNDGNGGDVCFNVTIS